jgi:hypothetical protein
MPGNQYINTFNRANSNGVSPGFYSRTLFTWVTPSDGYELKDTVWTDTLDGDGLDYLSTQKPEQCYGGYIFPPNYWTAGKTIRFRGTFFVASDDTDQIFNLRFGLQEYNTPSVQWLAIQNNDNNHIFAEGANTGANVYIPISFNCLLMCSVLSAEDLSWFTANGFYKYCTTPNASSTNKSVPTVPVWGNFNGTNGVSKGVDLLFTTQQSSLMMNCYGSTVKNIRLVNLTIEELL